MKQVISLEILMLEAVVILKNRFGPLYLLFTVLIVLSALIRTVLLFKALPNLDLNPLVFAEVYAVGFFYDCVTFFYFAFPLAVCTTVIPDRLFNHKYHTFLVYAGFFIIIYALVFDGVAEYLFFDEFGTRFNFIAVDYLVYTREVIGNIKESYPLPWIFSGVFCLTGIVFYFIKGYIALSFTTTSTLNQRLRRGLLFAALPVLAFLFVNLSFTAISKNSYANELAGNGIYDLFAAFRNNELDFEKFYLTRGQDVALARLRNLISEKNNRFLHKDTDNITRIINNPASEKKLNVIVVVEESLSAEYPGAFGNKEGLTPNLDRLAKESLFFTQVYATGTRTVRGLEAITLSMPPLPGTSILKHPGNEGLFSWGSVMKDKGYDAKYIYGGYGYFDNMNYFFAHNGFEVVDRSDFARGEITFANIWGVCDEDLFRKVIREADKSWTARKPFFSMVLTTSNHRPYTYPSGKIDIPSGTGRGGAVKYADYAFGELIAQARKRPWFADTLFVIVADHCASSAGKTDLPIKKYQIPLLVYSPVHVKPARVTTMASQIDIAPTVLGLLNFSYTTKFLGADILRMDPGRERAFLSTYQKLGFLEGNSLVVLGPKKYLKCYSVDRKSGSIAEAEAREEIVADALAYFQGTNYVYTNRFNRRPAPAD